MTVPLPVVQAASVVRPTEAAREAAQVANEAARTPRPFHCYFCHCGAEGAQAGVASCNCAVIDVLEHRCEWPGCPSILEAKLAPFGQSAREHYGFPIFERLIE